MLRHVLLVLLLTLAQHVLAAVPVLRVTTFRESFWAPDVDQFDTSHPVLLDTSTSHLPSTPTQPASSLFFSYSIASSTTATTSSSTTVPLFAPTLGLTRVAHHFADAGVYMIRVSASDISSTNATSDGHAAAVAIVRVDVLEQSRHCYSFAVWRGAGAGEGVDEAAATRAFQVAYDGLQAVASVSASSEDVRLHAGFQARIAETFKVWLQVLDPLDPSAARSKKLTQSFAQLGERPALTLTNNSLVQAATLEYHAELGAWSTWLSSRDFVTTSELKITGKDVALLGCLVRHSFKLITVQHRSSLSSFLAEAGERAASRIAAQGFLPNRVVHRQNPCSRGESVTLLQSLATELSYNTTNATGLGGLALVSHDSLSTTTLVDLLDSSDQALAANASLCAAMIASDPSFTDCSQLRVLDVVFALHDLVFVTNTGIFVPTPGTSWSSFFSFSLNVSPQNVSFVRVQLDDELEALFASSNLDTFKAEFTEDDYCAPVTQAEPYSQVFLRVTNTSSGTDVVLRSVDKAHMAWTALSVVPAHGRLLDSAYDESRVALVHLVQKNRSEEAYSVLLEDPTLGTLSSGFEFPAGVRFTGMVHTASLTNLCAYGTQVWCSSDGGLSFWSVAELPAGKVAKNLVSVPRRASFALMSRDGSVFFGRNFASGMVHLTTEHSTHTEAERVLGSLYVDAHGHAGVLRVECTCTGNVSIKADILYHPLETGIASQRALTPFHGADRVRGLAPVITPSHVELTGVVPFLAAEAAVPDELHTLGFGDLVVGHEWTRFRRSETYVFGDDGVSVSRVRSATAGQAGQSGAVEGVSRVVDETSGQVTTQLFVDSALALSACSVRSCPAVQFALRAHHALGFRAPAGDFVLFELEMSSEDEEGWLFTDVHKSISAFSAAYRIDRFINSTFCQATVAAAVPSGSSSLVRAEAATEWSLYDLRSFEETAFVGRQKLRVSNASFPEVDLELIGEGRLEFDASLDVGKIFALLSAEEYFWGVVSKVTSNSTCRVRAGGSLESFPAGDLGAGQWSLYLLGNGVSTSDIPALTADALLAPLARRLWSLQVSECPYSAFSDNTNDIPTIFLDVSDSARIVSLLRSTTDVRLAYSVSSANLVQVDVELDLEAAQQLAEEQAAATVSVDAFGEVTSVTEVSSVFSLPKGMLEELTLAASLDESITEDRALAFIFTLQPSSLQNTGRVDLYVTPTATSLKCTESVQAVRVVVGCPTTKRIVLRSAIDGSLEKWLDPGKFGIEWKDGYEYFEELPVNYRPPSSLGVAVPTTDNIYNGDPSRELLHTFLPVSENSGKFKRCAVSASERAADLELRGADGDTASGPCDCTLELRASEGVANSDCVIKARRLFYTAFFVPRFDVLVEGRETTQLELPMVLTEQNGREDWCLNSTSCSGSDSDREEFLRTAESDALTWLGPQLFHFRADVVSPDLHGASAVRKYSHCALSTEFVVYVKNPPLNTIIENVVIATSAMVIGLVLFFGYLGYVFVNGRGQKRA